MGESFEPGSWNVDMEVNLFHAMRGHKPVGVNRHFHMVIIHEKLNNPSTKKLTAKDVWDHLSTMYDLQALNESEILPFPNKPVEFKLPEGDYNELNDAVFPRMQNVTSTSLTEEVKAKPEGQAKGGKSSRSDSKLSNAGKTDGKGNSVESKGNSKADGKNSAMPESKTVVSKAEQKSGSSSGGRGEGKGGGKAGHLNSSLSASPTTDPSPKRTKRTRHNQSANSSPASDTPHSKRRR